MFEQVKKSGICNYAKLSTLYVVGAKRLKGLQILFWLVMAKSSLYIGKSNIFQCVYLYLFQNVDILYMNRPGLDWVVKS
jgi:hypothetical protein